jgi:hypothetical protein
LVADIQATKKLFDKISLFSSDENIENQLDGFVQRINLNPFGFTLLSILQVI